MSIQEVKYINLFKANGLIASPHFSINITVAGKKKKTWIKPVNYVDAIHIFSLRKTLWKTFVDG